MMQKHIMSPRVSLITNPAEDWMDKKKKLEGAEGLWRVHDKLYDFTLWSRTHPGGKFWLNVTRGTDITEVFESHHLSNKAESLLHKYYKREAATPRNSSTTFTEKGFYKIFKRKVLEQGLEATDKDSSAVHWLYDGLAAAVFLTGLLGIKNGIPWTIVCGVFLGVLSVSSHSFFHSKENWRINYFDLSLMSSRDWRIRHVLNHHQYRNTISDLETSVWKPSFENYKTVGKYLKLSANLLMFPVASHVQFLQRCTAVLLSKKLGFNSEELIGLSFPLFLFLFGGVNTWEVFVKWNLSVMIASFCFCLFGSSFLSPTLINLEGSTQREKQDFGIAQLSLLGNPLEETNFLFSFLNSFRGNALHYLCPRINCKRLYKFIPVLEDTLQEVGVLYLKKPTGFYEISENQMPQGHVFFS